MYKSNQTSITRNGVKHQRVGNQEESIIKLQKVKKQ